MPIVNYLHTVVISRYWNKETLYWEPDVVYRILLSYVPGRENEFI